MKMATRVAETYGRYYYAYNILVCIRWFSLPYLNVVLSYWNVNTNLSYINIGRKKCCIEIIRTLYEVCVLVRRMKFVY